MSQNELRFSYKIYSFSSKPRTTVKIIWQVFIVRTRIGRDDHFTAGSLLNIVESPVKQGIILRSGHRLFLSIKNIVGMKGGKFIDKYGHWLDRARLPNFFHNTKNLESLRRNLIKLPKALFSICSRTFLKIGTGLAKETA